jgi:hypothetical protein
MPYRLRKAPNRDLYWVVGEDGKKHSKDPIPKARAEAQMKALYIAMKKEGGGIVGDICKSIEDCIVPRRHKTGNIRMDDSIRKRDRKTASDVRNLLSDSPQFSTPSPTASVSPLPSPPSSPRAVAMTGKPKDVSAGGRGSGRYKNELNDIVKRVRGTKVLKDSQRRRIDNLIFNAERALLKLPKGETKEFSDATLYDKAITNARLIREFDDADPLVQERMEETAGPEYRNNLETIKNVIRRLVLNRREKQQVVNRFEEDLKMFLNPQDFDVRRIDDDATTLIGLEPIETGERMVDLKRAYFRDKSPRYETREVTERMVKMAQSQGDRVFRDPYTREPIDTADPEEYTPYIARDIVVPTKRNFTTFEKYIANPIKSLFVPPRHEDYFTEHDDRRMAEEERRIREQLARAEERRLAMVKPYEDAERKRRETVRLAEQLAEGRRQRAAERRERAARRPAGAEVVVENPLRQADADVATEAEQRQMEREAKRFNDNAARSRERAARRPEGAEVVVENPLRQAEAEEGDRLGMIQQEQDRRDDARRRAKPALDDGSFNFTGNGMSGGGLFEGVTDSELETMMRMAKNNRDEVNRVVQAILAEIRRLENDRFLITAQFGEDEWLGSQDAIDLANLYPLRDLRREEQLVLNRAYRDVKAEHTRRLPRSGGVKISKKAFVKEHKKLIGVLKKGKKSELQAEAKDQSEELAKMMKGAGLWDILNPSKVANEIFNPDSIVRRRITDVSKGVRKDYPPSVRRFLEANGNKKIIGLQIRRDPVSSAINKAFDVISLGQWSKAKQEENFDKLFHLGIILTLEGNKQVLVEKNEVINVGPVKARTAGSEVINSQHPYDTTLTQFLNKGIAKKGESFFTYDPFKNNCQDFIMLLLSANGVDNSKSRKFVKQNVETLVSKLSPHVAPVAKGITDIGAIANVALEGGRDNKRVKQPSIKKKKVEEQATAGPVFTDSQDWYQADIDAVVNAVTQAVMNGATITDVQEIIKSFYDEEPDDEDVMLWDQSIPHDVFDIAFENTQALADLEADGQDYDDNASTSSASGAIGSGGRKPSMKFMKQLKKVGIDPSDYLKEAQERAKEAGLPYKLLGFADDGDHKLSIPNADGQMRKFGKVGYRDFLIWSHLEKAQKVPKGSSDAKKKAFQRSHSAIKGDWKSDPFSPNNLALKILW